jgi:N-acetylglucosaminyldiphosphoundecaprenol N-acetyl-beta-D-mannosaminyltransferase
LQEARVYFQGVRVDNIDARHALSIVASYLSNPNGRLSRKVFFTNVHTIHLTREDKELQWCINEADLVLPDGSGLNIAGKVLGHPILENLNGTDFIPKVLTGAEQRGWTVYLFGAKPHIVEQCRSRLQRDFPKLQIIGHHHGHIHESDESRVIADINTKRPNILLVALGSPLQEKWIARNASNLTVGVCFAVGGLFDFLSGEFQRAPVWIRRVGAESLYRFTQDPRSKWRRIFVEQPLFLLLVFAARVIPWRAVEFITRSNR